MNLKTKKNCTYAVIVLYNLSIGIGYAIIFPTIWNYVHQRFDGNESMLGLVISSYSISSFFANLLVGWLGDKTQNTKCLLLITVVAEIIGSFMYFLGISNWFLVSSRFIAGMGGGGGAVVIADITRTTTEAERTSVLAMVVSSRQLGFLVGPALTLFLCKINTHIGYLPVDKFTSPGLFMFFLWLVMFLLIIFLYHNLTILKDEEDVEQLFPGYRKHQSIPFDINQGELENSLGNQLVSSYPSMTTNSIPYNNLSISVPDLQAYEGQDSNIKVIQCRGAYGALGEPLNSNLWSVPDRGFSECSSSGATDSMIEAAERIIQSASDLNHASDIDPPVESQPTTEWFLNKYREKSASRRNSSAASEGRFSLKEIVDRGFLRDEVVVLMGLSFISCFAQTVLETVVTPLAQKIYDFTEMQNSLMYLFCGIEVIIIYIALRYISHRVADKWLLLFGVIILCVATAIPLSFVPSATAESGSTFPWFVVTVVLDLIGIAVIIVCSASLLSKIVDQERQALAQGIRRSMVSLGCILGPLWGGGYLQQLYILFAVPLALSVFITVLLICSFQRLRSEPDD